MSRTSPRSVGVIGAGYVGLVTGVCMAHLGHEVVCMDADSGRVDSLRSGVMPIYEPDLEEMSKRCVAAGSLRYTDDLASVVESVEILFIAVGTPPGADGSADLGNVAAVARGIGQTLAGCGRETPLTIVNKSTVPVGSGDYVSMLVREGAEDADVDYRIVSNPEFLREGSAIYDTLFPDRIILGADSADSLQTMHELYRPIIDQSFHTALDPRPKAAVPFVTTDLASAEMIKYAANAFLATKISFINEMSTICDLVGADVASVAHGIGLDARIGPRFLSAGIGWGGSCFPKDVAALCSIAHEYDYEPLLLEATASVNQRQRKLVVSKLQRELHTLKGKRIAMLGLAFKPNTDDLREAPSLAISRMLDSLGARVYGYDPVAGEAATRLAPDILTVVESPYEAVRNAHAIVFATEWGELLDLDLLRVSELMSPPKLLIDGRNALDPDAVRRAGMIYRGFGRP